MNKETKELVERGKSERDFRRLILINLVSPESPK